MKLVFGTHRISERSKLEDQLQTDCAMFGTSLPAEDLRGRGLSDGESLLAPATR